MTKLVLLLPLLVGGYSYIQNSEACSGVFERALEVEAQKARRASLKTKSPESSIDAFVLEFWPELQDIFNRPANTEVKVTADMLVMAKPVVATSRKSGKKFIFLELVIQEEGSELPLHYEFVFSKEAEFSPVRHSSDASIGFVGKKSKLRRWGTIGESLDFGREGIVFDLEGSQFPGGQLTMRISLNQDTGFGRTYAGYMLVPTVQQDMRSLALRIANGDLSFEMMREAANREAEKAAAVEEALAEAQRAQEAQKEGQEAE